MKKLFLVLVFLLSVLSFGQAQTTKTYQVEDGKVVLFSIADKNGAGTSNYSDAIDVQGYFNLDSTSFYPIAYSGVDTQYVTIVIEGRYGSGATSNWQTLGTVVTNFIGWNDSLTQKSLVMRGSYSYDAAVVSFAGKFAQQIRIKCTYNGTIGDDARLKVWLFLPKKRYVSFKNNP